MTNETTALITFKNVNKIFNKNDITFSVLHDINFSINSGESVAIVGKSGSGKTTLMNLIGFLDTPTSGSYVFDGQSTQHFSDDQLSYIRNKHIGFIFQQFNLLPDLTALENVALPCLYAGLSQDDAYKRAQELLTSVELGDKLNNYPSQLSGGQQQRVAIARALANHPRIILADEPTGNLDSPTGQKMIDILLDLNKKYNITLILITHDPGLAEKTHRKLRLLDGTIIQDTHN